MCGIFGYVGKSDNAPRIVFEGLKTLEYRGYDSWGIATLNQKLNIKDKKLTIEKYVGKLPDVLKPQFVNLKSHIAFGHTRWATHGGVTEANAHPHLDCKGKIAVVHNGIVENFQELKKGLIKKDHKFVSQTDTEVIAHLVEEELKTLSLENAVSAAFLKLKGLNAFIVISDSQLVAAKSGSPLVVGIGKGELIVASDAAGILRHTNKVIFIDDGQMAVCGKNLKLVTVAGGKSIKPQVQTLDWKFEETEKGKHKHYFLKEIFEQPKVVEHIARNYSSQAEKFADLIEKAFGTFFIACGSASYAALYGTYLFSKLAKKHVNFAIGSEFNYLEDYLTPNSLVIPISQSGESVDVIEPVVRAKKKGVKVAALVNVLGSSLYRQADEKILLGAGVEKCVVATKSLIAMVAVLMLVAYTLAKKQKEGADLLLKAAKNIEKILNGATLFKIKKLAADLKSKDHVYVIGRGLSYATALEAALKLKEAAYVHAEGFAGGELKHGVIALIEKGTPCIVFAPNDETYDEIISNAQEVKARGGFIIGVGPKNNEVFDRWFKTADIAEATILPQIVYAQLLAYYTALERGVEDPDMPRNLAKSVTVK